MCSDFSVYCVERHVRVGVVRGENVALWSCWRGVVVRFGLCESARRYADTRRQACDTMSGVRYKEWLCCGVVFAN